MDRPRAEDYARRWAANWNAKDLEAILAQYAPDVVFRSPRIAAVMGAGQSSVSGLAALRAYWTKALAAAPEIRFEVEAVYAGGDALTILYRNHRGEQVAETLVFREDGLIAEGIVTSRALPPR